MIRTEEEWSFQVDLSIYALEAMPIRPSAKARLKVTGSGGCNCLSVSHDQIWASLILNQEKGRTCIVVYFPSDAHKKILNSL